MPKRAIGNNGIDASVFAAEEVPWPGMGIEKTLLKLMSELLKQFDSFTCATSLMSAKVISTHYCSY
jgi:hypothetical protein